MTNVQQLLEEKATLEQSIERLNAKVKGLAADKEKCKREVQEKERRVKFVNSDMQRLRPWWIRAHRCVAIPFRTFRRRLLTTLGIRSKSGHAFSEAFPEVAHRRAA